MSHVEFELDEAVFDNIRATLNDKSHVEIGVFDPAAAKVAGWHEYGSHAKVTPRMANWFFHTFGVALKRSTQYITLPARSFLRLTAARKASDFGTFLKGDSSRILTDITQGNWVGSLDRMGAEWVKYVKECFKSRGFGTWRKLSPLTIMRKWSDQPLIDTGKLESSVTHKMVYKGEI